MGLKSRINLIDIPEAIPQRGSKFSQFLGQSYMALIGWHLAGELPNISKFILVIAPHTSNVDFLIGLAPLFALDLRISFMAKSSLFWEPFGTYLRWVGAVPIDRDAPGGSVQEAVNQFQEREKFILGITPEGTRRKTTRWKTGFYIIADKAGVPMVPLTFDYSRHEFRFGKSMMPTGNMEADIKILQSFFDPSQARNPDCY